MSNVASYIVRIDNKEFPASYKLKSIVAFNEFNRVPRADLVLADGDVSLQDFRLSSQDFFTPGKKLEIDLGYDGRVENVFSGIVLSQHVRVYPSGESVLQVGCKHAAVRLTTQRKNAVYYDVTDQDAIAGILDDAGLAHSLGGLDSTRHLQLVQYDSTSWDFMVARVEANGCLLHCTPDEVVVLAPDATGAETLTCHYGVNVLAFDARINGESQMENVEAVTWDPAGQELLVLTETAEFTSETGNLNPAELSKAVQTPPGYLQSAAELPETELRAWARGKAMRSVLAKVTGSLRVRGNAGLSPGNTVSLHGFGDRFNGKIYVTGVRHEYGSGAWTTDIQFGLRDTVHAQRPDFNTLPAGGILPAVGGLHTGVVTALEGDPAGEFRIRVRLPVLNREQEGIWARIAQAYAGKEYGFALFPEIGDEVVVGFLNNDPRKAIVLGSLYSSANPPPLDPADDNHEKEFATRSKLRLSWNDEKKTITLSTPAGNEIILDEDAGKASVKDQHGNRIEMDSAGIVVNSSKDLKIKASQNVAIEGMDITLKAGGKFSAEGGSGVEVITNAIARLKGSLVEIN